MNQDYIGNVIKKIRKENGLTQEKFALKYNVTYQAVSKWERGKSIPDINILKAICDDYNLDINELLQLNSKKNKKNKTIFIFITIIIILIIFCAFLIIKEDSNDFNFKTLFTNCDDFKLFGTIAYSESKTSIYISNITYCGDKNNTKYKSIKCTLYETNGDVQTKIDSYDYKEEITLEDFLKNVKFNIEHYSKTCKMYLENALHIEIEAIDINGKTTFYKIPLMLDNC